MDKAINTIAIRLNITRLQLLLGTLAIVLIAGIAVFWRLGYFSKAYAFAFRSTVTVTVSDIESKENLPATITLTNTKRVKYSEAQTAKADGTATFSHLVRGNYKVEVVYSGYTDFSGSLQLKKRKGEQASYSMKKIPPREVTATGTVVNFINELPVEGATVIVGEKTAKTDKDGNFVIEKIITGDYDLSVKLAGYLDRSQKVSLVDDVSKLDKATLVPTGKVVFVSNRDKGKRGIYTSNYDGSDAKYLINRQGDQEDFAPQVSPDQKKVIFTSTREGKKDAVTNSDINNSYIVDIDGKNLNKIGDNVSYYYGGSWSKNSKYVIWKATARDESNVSTYSLNIYNVSSKENRQLLSEKNDSNSDINDAATLVAFNSNNSGKYLLNVYNIADGTTKQLFEGPNNIYLNSFKSNNEIIYNVYQGNQTKYFVINTDSGVTAETKLDNPKRYGIKSHSGKLLTFAEDRDGKSNIFTSDLNGNNEKQLSNIGSAMSNIDWSLDDKYIFFRVSKEGESALYVAGVDGGTAKKVTDVTREGYY